MNTKPRALSTERLEDQEIEASVDGARCPHCGDALFPTQGRRLDDDAVVEAWLCMSGCCQRCGRIPRHAAWQCEECNP